MVVVKDATYLITGATMKNLSLKLLTLSCMLALAACNKQEAPAEVQADVADAQVEVQTDVNEAAADAMNTAADGSKEVADAVAEASSDSMDANAKAAYDLAITKAGGELKVAKEKCDAFPSGQQSACNDTADAAYATAKAAAETERAAAQASVDAMKK